jgi:hypothetical protein
VGGNGAQLTICYNCFCDAQNLSRSSPKKQKISWNCSKNPNFWAFFDVFRIQLPKMLCNQKVADAFKCPQTFLPLYLFIPKAFKRTWRIGLTA